MLCQKQTGKGVTYMILGKPFLLLLLEIAEKSKEGQALDSEQDSGGLQIQTGRSERLGGNQGRPCPKTFERRIRHAQRGAGPSGRREHPPGVASLCKGFRS